MRPVNLQAMKPIFEQFTFRQLGDRFTRSLASHRTPSYWGGSETERVMLMRPWCSLVAISNAVQAGYIAWFAVPICRLISPLNSLQ